MRYQIIVEGKGGEPDRCEVETEQEIRLELYHPLIAAVDHREGEVRLIALAAIAKAEGRDSSKPLARAATKNGTQRARAYSGPEMPVTIGTTLLGYFVVVIKGPPERASLGMFSDAMPAVLAIFEQLFPESKSP
jgi:hypothetical protein